MTWIALTGFGPFDGVEANPSEAIARRLAEEPPRGCVVRHAVLDVTVEGSARELDALLAGGSEPPLAIVALGVHRDAYLRIERRARGTLTSPKLDNDGCPVAGLMLEDGVERATALDVEALAVVCRAAGASDVRVSDDAGGYICERVYHRLLGHAERLGVPGLFVHVPPYPVEERDAHVAAVAHVLRPLLTALAV